MNFQFNIITDKVDSFRKLEKRDRNRIIILALSLLFILDYFMFCYHVDKNIFALFPSIPSLEKRQTVPVYLPSLDGEHIFNENRVVAGFERDEEFVRSLFYLVVKGSIYENTSMAVPSELFVRKIWITGPQDGDKKGSCCIIDVEPAMIRANTDVISGSESNFRKALEKTITANIPEISSVEILEKGIPEKNLWEQ